MKVIKQLSFIFILLSTSLSGVYAQNNAKIPIADTTQVVLDTLQNANDTTKLNLDTLQNANDTTKLDLDTLKNDTLSPMQIKRKEVIEKRGLKGNGRGKKNEADTTKTTDSVAVETVVEDSITYGVETTRFIYEKDLLFNTHKFHLPDTLLTYRQRYSPLQKSRYLFQDLGNLGTAIQSIAYKTPEEIGTRWGAKAFDAYLNKPADIRYFDTFSPYTSLYVAQGGQGKSYLDVLFARNINSNWGFSVWYKRLTANRVVGNRFQRNDNQLTHQTVGYNTRFTSKNQKYKLLSYFQFYQHEILETGGLKLKDDLKDLNELYEVDNGELLGSLTNSNTIQTGKRFHVYQQYSVLKNSLMDIFYILDYSKQDNKFIDGNVSANLAFYDSTFFDTDSTVTSFYRTKLKVLKDQIGVKGELGNLRYRAYTKMKTYDFSTQFIRDNSASDTSVVQTLADELFAGGDLSYVFNEESYLNLSAEYLFENDLYLEKDTLRRVSDYQVSANFVHKNIKASYQNKSYRPDLIQQRFYGSHFRWDNRQAKNILSEQIKASYTYFHKDLAIITPFLNYTKLKNYVYYDSMALAKQDTLSTITYFRAGLEAKIKWKDLRSETKIIYTQNINNEIIPIPKLHINTILYHQNPIPHEVLKSQIGLEAHWKSAFSGQNYMPATQQFYLQNKHKIGNYVLLDIFFNFNISNVTISTKISNLLDRVGKQGYFETPFYMGKPRTFELNFTWLFFD